ncbi:MULTISPECIES: hypothetical protein [Erwinia]|uniref:hypothetical protein n=1 Tax=Erwinia TaxID=551 RepID=UPI000A55FC43|nr:MULTISPECIES: hypothetical protein [Erwinia]
MQPQTHDQKLRQSSKSGKHYYQAKAKADVTIPPSWELNELQRNFIESMIEKK